MEQSSLIERYPSRFWKRWKTSFKNKKQFALIFPLLLVSLCFVLVFRIENKVDVLFLYLSIVIIYAVFLFNIKEYSNSFWLVDVIGITSRFLPCLVVSAIFSNDLIQYSYLGGKMLSGQIPYRDFSAPYPPLSLYVNALFLMAEDPRFLKAFFSLCDVLTVFIVCKVFLQGGEDTNRISVLLLLFPVSLVEYSISGHNDSLTVLLLIASIALLNKNVAASSVLMALSILSKIFPIILVPFMLRQLYSNNKKSALSFLLMLIAVLSAISFPFILLSWDGYISMIIGTTRYSMPYGVLTPLLSLLVNFAQSSIVFFYLLATVLLIEFCVLIFVVSSRRKWPLMKTCGICLLILPFLLPQFHPWYLLWAFPFMITYYSNNLKIIRGYILLFLTFHILYYLVFSFN
jgi:uncharacterized membrane protein